MNQTPLWNWDVDQWSLDHSTTQQLLTNWINDRVRDTLIAELQNPHVYMRGARDTSSMERDC